MNNTRKKLYLHINIKFILTVIVAIIWTIICLIIDKNWFYLLTNKFGIIPAIIIVLGIAILPGVMICFFSLGGLFFDKPRHLEIKEEELEDITI